MAARDLYGGSLDGLTIKKERRSTLHMSIMNRSLTAISEETDLVYLETPTNPLMIEFDIAKVAKVAHKNGAKLIVDNTFYSPIYQNPITLGADIVVHSATKYLAGHNDVLAGVVITSDKAIYDKLFYNLNTTGPTLSPFDSYMLMRGLKTLKLRMKATENAQRLLRF